MKILIMGANGFLGRNFLMKIKETIKPINIYAVYNKNKNNIPPDVKLLHLSEINKIEESIDVIFHFGSHIPNEKTIDKHDYINQISLVNLLLEKFPTSKVIYSSTVSVYPANGNFHNEHSSITPQNIYAETKALEEKLIMQFDRYAIIRYSSLFGVGMNKGTIIPFCLDSATQKGVINLYGDGSREQDYIFIADAVQILLKAIDAPNGIYLGVNGMVQSNLQLAQIIAENLNADVKFVVGDQGPSFQYNNDWTKEKLGFQPEYDLEEGLKMMQFKYINIDQ